MRAIDRINRHIEVGPFPTEWWDVQADRLVLPPHDVGRCWLWVGKTDEKGYGRFVLDGIEMQAHRAVWITTGRELLKTEQLDHLCRRTRCVRPRHLDRVTNHENSRRSRLARQTTL